MKFINLERKGNFNFASNT